MKAYLAADLAGVFVYDFPTTCTVGGTTYNVLVGDNSQTEEDAFGGPQMVDTQSIHFRVSDLASIDNGTVLTLVDTGVSTKKLVVSNTISADGNEMIVQVRAA